MDKRITIRDIAKKAGVSVATVSNVINGVNKASDGTKKLVLQTIKEMGYQPNLTARSLSINRSHMIGVLLPIDESTTASLLLRDNPFYGEFISGVEYQSMMSGYDVLISGFRPGQSCREWILKRDLDGIVFVGNYTAAVSNDVKEFGSQLVLVDSYDEGLQKHHSVNIDDVQGGYAATKHLLDLGHKNIAIAASSILVDGAIYRRFCGYKDALSENGISLRNDFIFQDSLSFDGGYRIGLRILENISQISAVFAVADIMAFGIMKAFYENGKQIPRDLSIVGFDDIKTCEYVSPSLTSVHQPVYEKGITAVNILMDAIKNPDIPKRNVLFPLKLTERGSTMNFCERRLFSGACF
ncbi:MAG: LacI family transcriptional regulator [Oscillospiraceae bacterium]|nr:LacI family transcriptional regulator [Oscillospiraceae bacterium]